MQLEYIALVLIRCHFGTKYPVGFIKNTYTFFFCHFYKAFVSFLFVNPSKLQLSLKEAAKSFLWVLTFTEKDAFTAGIYITNEKSKYRFLSDSKQSKSCSSIYKKKKNKYQQMYAHVSQQCSKC